jgi:hypothetical protein
MANLNGVILEHRLVMAEHIGRMLTRDDIVHHINEDQTDNRIENLQLTNRSEHMSQYHAKGETMVNLKCSHCGSDFEREARNYRLKKKRGQKDFYCSRSCMAKNYGRGRPKKTSKCLENV